MSNKSRNAPPRAVEGQEGASGRPQVPEDPFTLFPGPTGLKSATLEGSRPSRPNGLGAVVKGLKEELADAWVGIDEEYNAGQPHTPARTFRHGSTGYHLQQMALLLNTLENLIAGED